MKQNIPLEEAQHLLLERVSCSKECCIPISEALGRIVSRDVVAEQSIPAVERSPYDGYAVRASDTVLATLKQPVLLWVMEKIPAGYTPKTDIMPGATAKVMTGAPIPKGADVVVKYEDVLEDGDIIHIFKPLCARNNIIYVGENIRQGELLAKRGRAVSPATIGLLAEQGIESLYVYETVKAALISTGDELVEVGLPLSPGKIYDSNRHTLQARCQELGINTVLFDHVQDRKEMIAARVQEGLTLADIVITTGGVSVGEYDVVREALEALEGDIIFWQVDIKPGSPILAASKNGKLIISLSGNPAAALITFDLLAVPVLKKILGYNNYFYPIVEGTLVNGFSKPSEQRRFLRAKLLMEGGRLWIKLMGIQNSSALKAMEECNLFVDVPAGSMALVPGDEVQAHIVGEIDGLLWL